jgi:L-threonylcarbamoyladenylate synthase
MPARLMARRGSSLSARGRARDKAPVQEIRQTRRLEAGVPADVERAVDILRGGGLVALPTETVYGLAARGLDDEAVRAIFAAKGRPQDNPVILHVAQPDDALPLWSDADERALQRARLLAGALWPGPLTIVCHKSALVSDVVTAGLSRVAVRVPAHEAFVRVARALGEPLAAPSANASGRPSPTSADDVLESLAGRIDAVLDGGPCRYGIESTVVDVTGERPVLLRPGATSLAELLAFLPDIVERAPGQPAHADEASPGLRHRHYAPAVGAVALEVDVAPRWGEAGAILCRAATARRLGPRDAPLEVLPDDAASYARGLYAALYRLERLGPALLVIEDVPADAAWTAVRDRLLRASG